MFQTKKYRAIKAFELQLDKLRNKGYYKDETWVSLTTDLIEKYIGYNTNLYERSKHFSFKVRYVSATLKDEEVTSRLKYKKTEAERIVNSAIDYINANGIIKPKKENLLKSIDNKLIYTIIVALFGTGYFCGDFFGSQRIDKEKYELEDSVEEKSSIILDKDKKINQLKLEKESLINEIYELKRAKESSNIENKNTPNKS